jgi:hypothetical protein
MMPVMAPDSSFVLDRATFVFTCAIIVLQKRGFVWLAAFFV